MARHRARSLRGFAITGAVLAICAALLFAVLGQSSAGAAPVAPGKSVTPSNGVVVGKCNFTVQSVNPSDGQVAVRLAAQARPATIFGYGTNAYTQVFCQVYSPFGSLLTQNDPFHNGPVVPNTPEITQVPFYNSYIVCGQALVKLNNGNTSLTPFVCA